MFHSVILPCRNRNRNLALCLRSIKRSAQFCGIENYEIIVADSHSDDPPLAEDRVTVLRDESPKGIFNKPRCQNIGIEAAKGDMLTFLDADAIVSPRFLGVLPPSDDDREVVRYCYRVRLLMERQREELEAAGDDKGALLDSWFDSYNSFPLLHEAYGDPERNVPGPGPLYGNSQFSIRRDLLGDLRYNEEYIGRGYEDLWMIREIGRQFGTNNVLVDCAMFHIESQSPLDWYVPMLNKINRNMYRGS